MKKKMLSKFGGSVALAKPKLLLVVDMPGWAFDIQAQTVSALLSHKYEFRILHLKDHPSRRELKSFDGAYFFYWKWPQVREWKLSTKKIASGITSYRTVDLNNPLANQQAAGIYKVFSANCVSLFKLFRGIHPNLFYAPNGVDTSAFKPLPKKTNAFTVGWVGNQKDPLKGYSYVAAIREACLKQGFRFVEATRENYIKHQDMPQFYNSLDCLISTSFSESGPNPCLEAGACEVPVISTRVGSMPEILVDGENGFLVEQNVDAFMTKINLLRSQRELGTYLGSNLRRTLCESWGWDKQIKNYDRLFSKLLDLDSSNPTNFDRWRQNERDWPERGAIICGLIESKRSVIDLGAGTQSLRKMIPHGASYRPVDLFPTTSDTWVMNFNEGDFPDLRGFDVVVCQGLLEYIADLPKFISNFSRSKTSLVCSYHVAKTGAFRHADWLNAFTLRELEEMFQKAGYVLRAQHAVPGTLDEVIFKFEHSEASV